MNEEQTISVVLGRFSLAESWTQHRQCCCIVVACLQVLACPQASPCLIVWIEAIIWLFYLEDLATAQKETQLSSAGHIKSGILDANAS